VQACENALEATFALISLAATDFAREDEFAGLVDDFKQAHKPRPEPLNPKFWREIPSVPGDGKWGDAPYPRHPEIELVRLQDIEKAHATRYNEA
jgi:hypothetical protein